MPRTPVVDSFPLRPKPRDALPSESYLKTLPTPLNSVPMSKTYTSPLTGSTAVPTGFAKAPNERMYGWAGGGMGALALDSSVRTNFGAVPTVATYRFGAPSTG